MPKISVVNIVGNQLCVEANDGEKIFELLSKALQDNKTVELSFLNVEMVTSAFLNTALGQLLRNFTLAEFQEKVHLTDLSLEDKALLDRVIQTAILFYADPDRLNQSVRDILGDDE